LRSLGGRGRGKENDRVNNIKIYCTWPGKRHIKIPGKQLNKKGRGERIRKNNRRGYTD
jgi:hypothetical protein